MISDEEITRLWTESVEEYWKKCRSCTQQDDFHLYFARAILKEAGVEDIEKEKEDGPMES